MRPTSEELNKIATKIDISDLEKTELISVLINLGLNSMNIDKLLKNIAYQLPASYIFDKIAKALNTSVEYIYNLDAPFEGLIYIRLEDKNKPTLLYDCQTKNYFVGSIKPN